MLSRAFGIISEIIDTEIRALQEIGAGGPKVHRPLGSGKGTLGGVFRRFGDKRSGYDPRLRGAARAGVAHLNVPAVWLECLFYDVANRSPWTGGAGAAKDRLLECIPGRFVARRSGLALFGGQRPSMAAAFPQLRSPRVSSAYSISPRSPQGFARFLT